jgi:cell division protein FtsX
MHDLDERLERLATEATRDAVPPGVAAVARRGRRRRRRQLAGTAALVAAVVAAGLVLPAHLGGRPGERPLPATAPGIDVTGAGMVGGYWFGKTDAMVYLGGGATQAEREAVRRRLQALGVVDRVYYESKAEGLARFKEEFRTKILVGKVTGPVSAMPESFRVRLDVPEDFGRLQRAFCGPGRSPRHGLCLDRVEVVNELALWKDVLVPEAWAASADLSVFLPIGTTDAEREAVRARLEAVGGVARVTYESPAQAYRRLPAWLRRGSADPARPIPPRYSPEAMRAAFRVALDQPSRVREFHLALCGSRTTGECPGGLVVLEHPRKR